MLAKVQHLTPPHLLSSYPLPVVPSYPSASLSWLWDSELTAGDVRSSSRAPAQSGYARTSIASSRSVWERPRHEAYRELRLSLGTDMHEGLEPYGELRISLGTHRPEHMPERMSNRMSERCQKEMPERMPNRMSEYIVYNFTYICQIECQKAFRIECQVERQVNLK